MRIHLFDHGHRPHLLVVAGSPTLARALSESASPGFFETTIAGSRAEALRAGESQSFAGYVIDANLPDAHGLELVRDLRDARVSSPILFLDSLAGTSPIKNDADATLMKPVGLLEFRSLLRELFLPDEAAANAPVSRRRRPSFHLSTLMVPALLAAGIALTYWLLSLT